MMTPRTIVIAFVTAVAAAIAGWGGGALLHEALGDPYEIAVGVVDTQVGAPVATASPSPSPSEAPTTAPATQSPSPSPSPTVEPTPEESLGPCPGTPPAPGCECRRQRNNTRWVCPVDFD
jgi:hypothetical protein